MRFLLLASLLAGLSFQCAAQTAPAPAATTPLQAATTPLQAAHTTARVNMAEGKYVFFFNQPASAYDVVFTFTGTAYTPSEQMTLNTLVNASLTGAQLEAGAQLKAYDAIIIQTGSRDVAIKFRPDVSPEQRPLATVSRQAGFPVFLFCEPVGDYQVVKTERVNWYNRAFGGAYYTVATVQNNLVKTAAKTKKTQGVIFGETASYISFN